MCLSTVWSKKKMDAFLAEKPERFTAYKVMRKYRTQCGPPYNHRDYRFRVGLNHIAEPRSTLCLWRFRTSLKYTAGYHCFVDKRAAQKWRAGVRWQGSSKVIVPCKVKREWVETMGLQEGHVVIVAHTIDCPASVGGKE